MLGFSLQELIISMESQRLLHMRQKIVVSFPDPYACSSNTIPLTRAYNLDPGDETS